MGILSRLFGRKKQDEPPYPSWAGDSSKMEGFIATLKVLAKQKNIPEKFLGGVMINEYSQNKLMFIAGIMEQQGSPYDAQVKAVMDHIERYWYNADDKEMWFS